MISLIIPFRDKVKLLRECVGSVLGLSTFRDFEILLVDNGSEKKETAEYLEEMRGVEKVRVLKYPHPFNFSAINNFAAREARGEFLLFLNNDTKVISSDWMEKMVGCFAPTPFVSNTRHLPLGQGEKKFEGDFFCNVPFVRGRISPLTPTPSSRPVVRVTTEQAGLDTSLPPLCLEDSTSPLGQGRWAGEEEYGEVGVVGAKLLYADGTIQHLGVEIGGENVAVHSMRKWKEGDIPEEFRAPFGCDAVTGACMMTRRDLFLRLGGFDEKNLPIAYNDVEYCLRARRAGYGVVCQPEAKLYHYESASRMSDLLARWIRPKRWKEFLLEREFLKRQVTRDKRQGGEN